MPGLTKFMVDGSGGIQEVSADDYATNLMLGWTPASDAQIAERKQQDEFVATDAIKAGAASAASTLSMGLSDVALTKSGAASPEELKRLEETYPISAGIGTGIGVIAPALVSGGGSAAVQGGVKGAAAGAARATMPGLARAAGAGAEAAVQAGMLRSTAAAGAELLPGALGLGERVAARAVGAGVGNATEGLFYGTGQVIHEYAVGDPGLTGESAAIQIGFSGLLGGAMGAGAGAFAEVLPTASNAVVGGVSNKVRSVRDIVVEKYPKMAAVLRGNADEEDTIARMMELRHVSTTPGAVKQVQEGVIIHANDLSRAVQRAETAEREATPWAREALAATLPAEEVQKLPSVVLKDLDDRTKDMYANPLVYDEYSRNELSKIKGKYRAATAPSVGWVEAKLGKLAEDWSTDEAALVDVAPAAVQTMDDFVAKPAVEVAEEVVPAAEQAALRDMPAGAPESPAQVKAAKEAALAARAGTAADPTAAAAVKSAEQDATNYAQDHALAKAAGNKELVKSIEEKVAKDAWDRALAAGGDKKAAQAANKAAVREVRNLSKQVQLAPQEARDHYLYTAFDAATEQLAVLAHRKDAIGQAAKQLLSEMNKDRQAIRAAKPETLASLHTALSKVLDEHEAKLAMFAADGGLKKDYFSKLSGPLDTIRKAIPTETPVSAPTVAAPAQSGFVPAAYAPVSPPRLAEAAAKDHAPDYAKAVATGDKAKIREVNNSALHDAAAAARKAGLSAEEAKEASKITSYLLKNHGAPPLSTEDSVKLTKYLDAQPNVGRKVQLEGPDGKVLTYPSVEAASKATKIKTTDIKAAAEGYKPSAGKWSYPEAAEVITPKAAQPAKTPFLEAEASAAKATPTTAPGVAAAPKPQGPAATVAAQIEAAGAAEAGVAGAPVAARELHPTLAAAAEQLEAARAALQNGLDHDALALVRKDVAELAESLKAEFPKQAAQVAAMDKEFVKAAVPPAEILHATTQLRNRLDDLLPVEGKDLGTARFNTLTHVRDASDTVSRILHDQDLWGTAASKVSRLETAHKNLERARYDLVNGGDLRLLRAGRHGYQVDPARLRGWLKDVDTPAGQARLKAFQRYLRAADIYTKEFDSAYSHIAPKNIDPSIVGKLVNRTGDAIRDAREVSTAEQYRRELTPKADLLGGPITKGVLGGAALGPVGGVLGALHGLYGVAKNAPAAVAALAALENAASAVSERLDVAVGTLVRGSIKGWNIGRGEAAAGVGRVFAHPYEKSEKNYRKASEQATYLAGNPEALATVVQQQTDGLHQWAPETAKAMQQTTVRAVLHLAAKARTPGARGLLQRQWAASATDIAVFNRAAEIVENPEVVLKQAAAGTLTSDAVETLEFVYPAYYAELTTRVFDWLSDLDHEPSQQTKNMLSTLLKRDLDGSGDWRVLLSNQTTYTMSAKPQAPSRQPDQRKSITLADRALSPMQQLEQEKE